MGWNAYGDPRHVKPAGSQLMCRNPFCLLATMKPRSPVVRSSILPTKPADESFMDTLSWSPGFIIRTSGVGVNVERVLPPKLDALEVRHGGLDLAVAVAVELATRPRLPRQSRGPGPHRTGGDQRADQGEAARSTMPGATCGWTRHRRQTRRSISGLISLARG